MGWLIHEEFCVNCKQFFCVAGVVDEVHGEDCELLLEKKHDRQNLIFIHWLQIMRQITATYSFILYWRKSIGLFRIYWLYSLDIAFQPNSTIYRKSTLNSVICNSLLLVWAEKLITCSKSWDQATRLHSCPKFGKNSDPSCTGRVHFVHLDQPYNSTAKVS